MNDINLTIGSDPEFIIVCGDSVENALKIFQKLLPGVTCLPTLEINQYYMDNEYEYLQTALCDMELEYIKDNYREILKNHHFVTPFDAANIIMHYYDEQGYPEWVEVPTQVQHRIISRIEEEFELGLGAGAGSYYCTTEIGCDEQSALGELRPKHGNNPIEHFNEILKLMKEMNDLLEPEIVCYGKELQIKAGAYQGDKEFDTFSLGGHIHLGCNKYTNIDYLSEYLSFFCGIPLTLITDIEKKFYDNTSERDMRHKQGEYGEYGSYREKEYGIEFRMPSSWLVFPQITIGALSLAYIVGYEFLSKEITMSDPWELRFRQNHGIIAAKYIEWYERQNWVLLQGEFEPIKLEIQQMKLYPKYKEYIDYILDMIDNNETWHSERDIMPLWAELW